MRPPRFRLWTLMVAVAVVAIALGCTKEGSRIYLQWLAYRDDASRNRSFATKLQEAAAQGKYIHLFSGATRPVTPAEIVEMNHWAAEYDRLARMYEGAAAHPWRTVPTGILLPFKNSTEEYLRPLPPD